MDALGILDALPMAWAPPDVEVRNSPHWPLARGEVKFVGDPVAVVIGEGRYAMVDAAESVVVDLEPLPVAIDIEAALEDGAPLVHEELGTNKVHEWTLAGGDVEQGFAEADVVGERRLVIHRMAGAPIEPRGVVAEPSSGCITLTSSTQIVADQFGVDLEARRGHARRHRHRPHGLGTYGSRTTAVGGEASCAPPIRSPIRHAGSSRTCSKPSGGHRGQRRHVLGQGLARQGHDDGRDRAAFIPDNLPEGMDPGLEETSFYDPSNFVFPFGAHAAVVEFDRETDRVDVCRYVAVDDCEPAINPNLIDGQVHGRIVHSIGQVLCELVHYDEAGQLPTGTFVDYCLASATDAHLDRDRPHGDPVAGQPARRQGRQRGGRDRGVRGGRQRGDRLRAPARIDYLNMPLTPLRIWEAINRQGGAAA